MNPSPIDSSASGSQVSALVGKPFFQSDKSPGSTSKWGELFEVFGPSLDSSTQRMRDAVPDIDDLIEDVEASARRYAAFIETMCMNVGKPGTPLISYAVAPGFKVLLTMQVPADEGTVGAVQQTYEAEHSSVPEESFVRLLSTALKDFFDQHVAPGSVVYVELEGCDYMFVRDADHDDVLKGLNVGTTASQY